MVLTGPRTHLDEMTSVFQYFGLLQSIGPSVDLSLDKRVL